MTVANENYVCGCVEPGDTVHGRDIGTAYLATKYCHRTDCPGYEAEEAQVITTIDLTSWGDYAGTDIERSNYRRMLEDFGDELVEVSYAYNGQALAYLGDFDELSEPLREALGALSEYPIYDEDDTGSVQMDLVLEQWEDYGRKEWSEALAECIAFRFGIVASHDTYWARSLAREPWSDLLLAMDSRNAESKQFEATLWGLYSDMGQEHIEPGGSVAWDFEHTAERVIPRDPVKLLRWLNAFVGTAYLIPGDSEEADLAITDGLFNMFASFDCGCCSEAA